MSERDEELIRLRNELDRYKQQAAREIANKTKVAQALDESHEHARELEELLQSWQLEVNLRITYIEGGGSLLIHTGSKVFVMFLVGLV